MDNARFAGAVRALSQGGTRRGALGLLAGIAGVGLDAAAARNRKKRRRKKCANCCRARGTSCKKKSRTCKKKFCLSAPFAVEARWTNAASDHDTYVFVPNAAGASLDSPFIDYGCNPDRSDCEDDVYPFICVDRDAPGPGDEVTRVRKLIPGTYEYWIEPYIESPAGDVTVALRDKGGRLVRSWSSPPNPSATERISWHVFDVDGATGSVTSVDEIVDAAPPNGAHSPNSGVCPGN